MMKIITKRTLALILAVMLLIPAFSGAEEDPGTGKDGWHFDEKGFLTGEDNPGDEYLLEDEENGQWQYASRDLSIRVTRFREQYNKKKIREYCVAEIWASEKEPLTSILSAPKGKYPEGVNQVSPELLVEKHPCIFAMSDDMYGQRQYNIIRKTGSRQPGIIIRNGEIRWDKTKARDSKYARQRPCLDVLAVYDDGSMKAYISDEMTAEEYIENGARQTFAFGPWLIRDGEINEAEGTLYGAEPLVGLGMVEPYHYIAVLIKGRPKTKYAGARWDWLAAKLQEYGCTEAINLDGGGTACMFFNGKVIIQGDARLRSMGGMIAFGLK